MQAPASTSEYNQPAGGRQLEISLFDNRQDRTPVSRGASWAKLRLKLSQHATRESKDGAAWSPVKYRAGATRGVAGVESVSLLVLDVDHADLPYEALTGYAWLAHTTHSHAPGDPRWRLVLPLVRPVAAADWPDVIERAYGWLGGVADKACRDVARLFYLPAHRQGEDFRVEHGDGRWLDPDELPAVEPSAHARSPLADRVDVAGLLDHGAPEGERDHELFRLASKLRRADVPYEWAARLVSEAAAKCSPPFREWQAKVDSAYGRYQPLADETAAAESLPTTLYSLWSRVVRSGLSAQAKLVAFAVATEAAAREARGHFEPFTMYRDTPNGTTGLAQRTGLNKGTVTQALEDLQAHGALVRESPKVRRPDGTLRPDGYLLTLRDASVEVFLDTLASVQKQTRRGGERPGAGRPTACPDHPTARVVDRSGCSVCGQVFYEAERQPKNQTPSPVTDADFEPEIQTPSPVESTGESKSVCISTSTTGLRTLRTEFESPVGTGPPVRQDEHSIAAWLDERIAAGESP